MDPLIARIILAAIGAALLVWDVLLWLDGTPRNTISEIIRDTSKRWLIIPFAGGVLAGHFFWPL